MDFVSRRHLIHVSHRPCMSQAPSPVATHRPDQFVHPASTYFPMIAFIVIGMITTSLFLMCYYIFLVKCCLNLNRRVDIARIRRLSLSWQREEPIASANSQASEPRGLDEAVIRSIPVIHYKTESDRDFCECAVCLNEFQEDQKLRVIPNCSHVFHIDCIDAWLQNNVNCPLCRRCISLTTQTHVDDQLLMTPRPSRPQDQDQDQSQNVESLIDGEGEIVVIDLDEEHEGEQNKQGRKERGEDLELPTGPIGPSQRKLEQRIMQKKARKLHKVTSMEYGAQGNEFSVQPMKRSFSMES